jgi:hypothetical protein
MLISLEVFASSFYESFGIVYLFDLGLAFMDNGINGGTCISAWQ